MGYHLYNTTLPDPHVPLDHRSFIQFLKTDHRNCNLGVSRAPLQSRAHQGTSLFMSAGHTPTS